MDKKLNKENLKIAIQKDGRLTEDSLRTLRMMGLEFEVYGRRLFAACRNYPVEILFCRDDDIPGYIERGTVDMLAKTFCVKLELLLRVKFCVRDLAIVSLLPLFLKNQILLRLKICKEK